MAIIDDFKRKEDRKRESPHETKGSRTFFNEILKRF